MKLSLINESSQLTLYKGVSEYGGISGWPTHEEGSTGVTVPGFLSNYEVARTYSQPSLVSGPESSSMIIRVNISKNSIEDRTTEFFEWARTNQNNKPDISIGFPEKWRNDSTIWTVKNSGSGHDAHDILDGASFVYCGVKLKYFVVSFYQNESDWEADDAVKSYY